MEIVFDEVTPTLAREMLETLDRPPAPVKAAVTNYAQAMREDGWIVNGMPIIFDRDGRLIDGEQRLEAAIAADKPFRTAIAFNVAADTLHTIDQHRRRTYAGVLEARGLPSAGSLLRAMGKLIRIENGTLGMDNAPISWLRYDRVLAANPELVRAVQLSEEYAGSSLHSTPRPVLAFMAIRAGHKMIFREFMNALIQPDAFPIDHPAAYLANQLASLRENGAMLDNERTLSLAILAFNDFASGNKARKSYRWKPDFGKAALNKDGTPKSWKEVREKAPDNLGMPVMDGYPGLEDGKFDETTESEPFDGDFANSIKNAVLSSPQDEQAFLVTVTPEMAEHWLEAYNTKNRKVQKNHVEMIARDIKDGNWMVNAQPICFTGNPLAPDVGDMRLLNGQHRLHACAEAGIPIELPIAINISGEAFPTFDIHAKRAASHGTSRKGDARVVNAAAKLLWRHESGMPETLRKTPSASELKKTIEEHPGLAECFPRSRRRAFLEIGSAGIITYLIYRVTRDDPVLGERFLQALETGEEIERGNPVASARTAAVSIREQRNRASTLIVLLEAWEKYQEWAQRKEAEGEQSTLL